MSFNTEPSGYQKTALSDLQGAWMELRQAVVDHFGFPDSKRLLFHIDEAMSWESVRDLPSMRKKLLLIENIIAQSETPQGVTESVGMVRENMEEVLSALKDGERF